jgi:hypothetical protein
LNTDLKTGNLKVYVVIVPMSRDRCLGPYEWHGRHGRGHGHRQTQVEKLVAFSVPTRTNVSEVVVTGPSAADRHGRRPGGPGGVCPKNERLLRDARRLNGN